MRNYINKYSKKISDNAHWFYIKFKPANEYGLQNKLVNQWYHKGSSTVAADIIPVLEGKNVEDFVPITKLLLLVMHYSTE